MVGILTPYHQPIALAKRQLQGQATEGVAARHQAERSAVTHHQLLLHQGVGPLRQGKGGMMGMATRSGFRLVGRSGNPVIKASTTRSSTSWKVRRTPTMFARPTATPAALGC